MDYETISKMKVEELKAFLRLRGLKLGGRKKELVARVFSAVENNIPISKTAEEIEGEIQTEYKQKLVINDRQIPDPAELLEWKGEEDGIQLWPLVSTLNVIKFLMIDSDVEDLNDYKSSKAYSYFKKGWLGELMYHSVPPFCFIKTDCRPSQRLTDTKHKLWLLLSQDEGQVIRAHCSCMAGMGSSCNHVAAALFRLEAAMRLGLCNPACTTKPCEWLPNRKDVQPCKVMEMDLNRDDFKNRGKRSKKIISTPKRNFNPLASTVHSINFKSIVNSLGDLVDNTVLSTAIPKPKIDFVREILDERPVIDEPAPCLDDAVLTSTNEEEFFANLTAMMSKDNISKIEQATRGQSSNELWFEYRKGVITASKVHEVKTKMTKLVKNSASDVNIWNLIQKVAGMTFINPNIKALKYGREMEDTAAENLLDILKLSHKNCVIDECGLFLHESFPYIGASPDRIFSCSCHGKFCVEIKCPFSISHLSPTDETANLIYMDGNRLKSSHQYYTQCQLQMGVTGIERCIFFVFTCHGYILSEILFEKDFYANVIALCNSFYKDFYVKSLFK